MAVPAVRRADFLMALAYATDLATPSANRIPSTQDRSAKSRE